jgi:hypothetical protein
VAWGVNFSGQNNVPALPPGLSYTQVAAGEHHNMALRIDGSLVAWGDNSFGQTNVPPLQPGLGYTQVAAGSRHTVALRSDGLLVAWGSNSDGQTNVPALPPGMTYTQVAGGSRHTVALRSDGSVVAWGDNSLGQTSVPALPLGRSYSQVAAGYFHTVALRSDGSAVAWGYNGSSQINVPALPPGISYTQVAASYLDTMALVSVSPQLNVIGSGCTGSNGVTTLLSTQLPFLGNTAFSLDVSQAALNSQAYLFVATALAPAPIAAGGGCFIYLDAQSLLALVNAGLSPLGPEPTGPAGVASFLLPVPASPALAGLSIAFQAAVLDATAPLALTLSNAVQCVLN